MPEADDPVRCLWGIWYGEVPKRLKGLASNTSRSVTRREGSNPSFSAHIKADKAIKSRGVSSVFLCCRESVACFP